MTIHRTHETPVITNVSRRRVLKGLAAGGLVVAAQFPVVRDAVGYPTGADKMPNGTVSDPHIFVSIARDGTVTIVAARAEMGTGAARTTLPLMIADELEADWAKVRIKQSEGDEVKYGNQDTDGSRSTRHFIQPMRLFGASMRTMLEQAAAKKWGVAEAECVAENHQVVHKPTGRKFGYGELAADASALAVPAQANDMSLRILVPAFMISELKRAFEIGFLLFLPFLIIDLVVASVLMSMGMMMLPPVVVSLPFKLIFFVLVDGWHLVAGSLVQSYGT